MQFFSIPILGIAFHTKNIVSAFQPSFNTPHHFICHVQMNVATKVAETGNKSVSVSVSVAVLLNQHQNFSIDTQFLTEYIFK